jgi:methionyl-tRNA formyltransferase
MSENKIRLIFMGTPVFAIPVLRALTTAQEAQVIAVFTPPDRPKGRGRAVEMPPVKGYAVELGLPVFQPVSLRSQAAQEELAKLRPDVIVIAAYGKLLPPPVLNTPPHGCLNLHPSLLPRYRGPSPVATAILNGEEVTGVTLMLLDEGMDTGPIISQREYALSGRETAVYLTQSLFQTGAQLLLDTLGPWVAGRVAPRPQDEIFSTPTRKLERGDGAVDWRVAASELERRCRAFSPWPGLFTKWNGKVLKLLDVLPLPVTAASQAGPGLVVPLSIPETSVGVGTGDGILGLRSVQLEGRRALPAAEFLQGYPQFLGARL